MRPAEPMAGSPTMDNRAGGSIVPHALAHDHRLHNRVLRVRITDVDTGRVKVALMLPVGLVGVAVRLGARLVPASPDASTLLGTIERGELKEPVEILDEENGERVEIALEG